MTREEITTRLNEWQQTMQSAEVAISGLMDIIGCVPEAPLYTAISALQGLATRQAAELIGTSPDWLENWWLEDHFGERPLKVQRPGQDWREVTTIEELANVIADELESLQ